ncbi:MAG: metal ABC transporter permease, partial [Pantoea agglomerans]
MWIFEPFQFAFMNSALLIALVVAIPCALLSVFLVLKGWALMGDAMSHAVFPGIVLAWMAGLPLAVGAFVAGLFCAVASGFLQDNSRIKQDTVLGIVFSGMFAVGLILYIAVKPEVHLDHILFGDMLGITGADIIQTSLIAAVIVGVIAVKWRDFMLFSFDPQQAQVSGLPARWLHYGLLCMVSLTIVATLKAVGIILSISLLIAPGAIAVLLTRRFSHALLVAVVVSVLVSLSGVYLSFFIDSAPAPTIVVLFALVFIVAM